MTKASCDACLQRLKTDRIDLCHLHRRDKTVPIENSVGAMSDPLCKGQVRLLGRSAVSATMLRRAHAVQTEHSLWTREPEVSVLDACRDIGATLARHRRDIGATSARQAALRARPLRHPPGAAAGLRALAREAGATPAQWARAWLLARGEHIVPIPGTRSVAHLRANLGAADILLSQDLVARLDALIHPRRVSGARYNPATTAEIDTEQF